VLYAFTGGQDGANPASLLLFDQAGNLYCTAMTGGIPGCVGYGCGTVYELIPSLSGWTEHTLSTFQDGADGAMPSGGWCGLKMDTLAVVGARRKLGV
jgi:hypothetical protein